MLASPRLVDACLKFCIGALLVEIISFCIPGWLIFSYDNKTFAVFRNYAVWYVYECIRTRDLLFIQVEACSAESYAVKLHKSRIKDLQAPVWKYAFTGDDIQQIQLFTTIGVVCLIIATFLLVKLRHSTRKALTDRSHTPSDLTFCLPAVLTTASGALYCSALYYVTQAYIPPSRRSDTEVPYGSIVAAFGAFLSFCVTVMVLVVIVKKRSGEGQGDVLDDGTCQSGQTVAMMPQPEDTMGQPPPPYKQL